ncbi:MAG: (d)CMP kinase, partial [Chlamydiota bacterium]
MIITIDGSSGTGKTTVARHVAEKLHFAYFDTGAMYRAFTWYVLEHNVDI